jgi:hypothetical protein
MRGKTKNFVGVKMRIESAENLQKRDQKQSSINAASLQNTERGINSERIHNISSRIRQIKRHVSLHNTSRKSDNI